MWITLRKRHVVKEKMFHGEIGAIIAVIKHFFYQEKLLEVCRNIQCVFGFCSKK